MFFLQEVWRGLFLYWPASRCAKRWAGINPNPSRWGECQPGGCGGSWDVGDDVADGGRLPPGGGCEVVCEQAGRKGMVGCMGKKGRPTVHKSRDRCRVGMHGSRSCSCSCQ